MTCNIGNQSGGTFNNVAGDQTIYGGQHSTSVTSGEARVAVGQLADALAQGPLHDPAVAEQTEQLQTEMRSPEPDKGRVAVFLDRLVRALNTTGAWVKAGAAALGPIRTIATWLGTLGVPILGLLPAIV